MTFSDVKKGSIFKALATKSFKEVGYEFELDKYYKGETAVKNAVYRIYLQVRSDPEKFAISDDLVQLVVQAIEDRKSSGRRPSEMQAAPPSDLIDASDMKQVILGGRNKAAMLMHKKMDRISKNNKLLDKENIVSLAKVFGIFFDKGQIIQGQATEHIAHMAKIGDDMTPEQQVDALLKMRQKNQEDKYGA